MPDACKQPESKQDVDARSTRVLDLFQAINGRPLKDFPVPPLTKWLNGKIVAAGRGEVTVEHVVRPEMANPTGLLHGGMMCAMLDDVIGMTSATLGHKGFLLSIDMNVNYLGKVKVGEALIARGRIAREGRTIVNATAELADRDGHLVATASSNLLLTGHEPDFLKQIG
ncbi:MAG: PaaI family thioesterase [Candidatus Lokiarchaeota archaeon]|nr:PaaI family thioesterase [Candidatus Lokiarchaeota archaeon]